MKNFFKNIVFAMAALLTINLTAQAQDKDALVDIKNGKLHAVVTGDGPYTVVFEAGFISDLSVWRKVAPTVAKQAQIVVYSRAGVGKSPARSQPLNLLQHTEELQQLITQLNDNGSLTEYGAEYVNELAGEIVRASNQIRQNNAQLQGDRILVAQEKLKELQKLACEDFGRIQEYLDDFEW